MLGPEKERLIRDVLDLDESEAAGTRIVNLKALAVGRRNRLQSNGRPRFDLADDEIQRSTETAMRLADGAPSDTTRPMTTREAAHTLIDAQRQAS